jgi:HAD superfamily hydrolase (TIGR01509 family)
MAQFEDLIWPTVTALVDELPLLPGVAELIAAAQHHEWNIGIGTGQHRATVEQRLARLGVLDSFDAIVTVHDVGRSKPAPDIFLAVAARLGVDHAECYVLEDSLPGCEAALAAGMNLVICPSVVSASLPFPDHVVRVASLLNVTLDHERLVASSPR